MKRWLMIAMAVLALAGCSTDPATTHASRPPSTHAPTVSPWYEAGRTWEIADHRAGQSNIDLLYGSPVTPRTWCAYMMDAAYNQGSVVEPGTEVPLGLPPVPVLAQDDQWVNGCVAGYWAAR